MSTRDEKEQREKAFLDLIRYAESDRQVPSNAYSLLYGRIPFGSLRQHPWLGKNHAGSTAAGAYQILVGTYQDAVKNHVAHDFSERSQDAIAMWHSAGRSAIRHTRRQA